jgi:hypothetical protein
MRDFQALGEATTRENIPYTLNTMSRATYLHVELRIQTEIGHDLNACGPNFSAGGPDPVGSGTFYVRRIQIRPEEKICSAMYYL